jgi:hypothetical protein
MSYKCEVCGKFRKLEQLKIIRCGTSLAGVEDYWQCGACTKKLASRFGQILKNKRGDNGRDR